ncbi:MAG: hypothetical protein AB7O59_13150 [Pirellulales bacterium]
MSLLLAEFESSWEPLVWFALGILGSLGIVAVLDPRRIASFALGDYETLPSGKAGPGAEVRAAGSFVILALCRLFGLAVLAIMVALAYWLAKW